jgi:hypothetical protein
MPILQSQLDVYIVIKRVRESSLSDSISYGV